MSHNLPLLEKKIQRGAEKFRPVLLTGIYVGTLMVIVMFGSLVAANRMPSLEPFALERNGASYGAFMILMLIPVLRFLAYPKRMYISAMIAWGLFVIGYNIAGLFFRNLFIVLRTPMEALVEGSLAHGVLAVAIWVGRMAVHASRHPMPPSRRPTDDIAANQR